MTISRPLAPGEEYRFRLGMQDEGRFLNRIYIGQIDSVDEDNGTVEMVIFGLGSRDKATIPLHAFSLNNSSSSWIRYMPQKGDFVKVGFGPDKAPIILGYTFYRDNAQTEANGSVSNPGAYQPSVNGYRTLRILKDQSDAGVMPPDPDTGVPQTLGFRDFIPLKSGEWDMRSTGGAYIHGSEFGVLTLAGGQNLIKVDKDHDEVSARSNLFKLDAQNDTFLRIGDIKRFVLPTDAKETNVSASIAGISATREYHLQVAQVISPTGAPQQGIPLPLPPVLTAPITQVVYDERIGDVRDDTGLPVVPPLVVERKANSVAGLNLHKFTVDQTGVVTMTAALTLSLQAGLPTPFSYSVVRGEALNVWLMTELSVLTAFGPSGPAITPLTATSLASPGTPVTNPNITVN